MIALLESLSHLYGDAELFEHCFKHFFNTIWEIWDTHFNRKVETFLIYFLLTKLMKNTHILAYTYMACVKKVTIHENHKQQKILPAIIHLLSPIILLPYAEFVVAF